MSSGDSTIERLEVLYRIGDGKGANRPGLSPEEDEAHRLVRSWMEAAGLATSVDAAGNLYGRLTGTDSELPEIWCGSHLDSVPHGGRYDGALGVVAALHVLLALQGHDLPLTLEAIDFTDEEGTLVGLLGSEALTGVLSDEVLRNPRGGRDALLAGLERAGLREEQLHEARRDPATLAGYVELHIEQGPGLERAGAQIGIVTGIVGARSFTLDFRGDARHAGTTPMDARRDAGLAAAVFAAAANTLVVRDFPGCVATIGDMRFHPGAFNIVPGSVRVSLEFRALELEQLDALEIALLDEARAAAAQHALGVDVTPVGHWEPTALDAGVRDAIETAADGLGLVSLELPSGAGHDAQALAGITPSGMIFVPSTGGISHNPSEHTEWQDCVNGANTLLRTALELCRSYAVRGT
jgi:N-carbamoyl-L-amino-acid hydrolase